MADTNKASLGDIILQPGPKDGGRRHDPDSRIATLYRFVPICFEPETRNLVDCAFALLLGDVQHHGRIVTDPHNPATAWDVRQATDDLITNDVVRKVGRTTGYTEGTVTAIDVSNLVVAMITGTGERLARFDGQIAIEGNDGAFSAGGDSGSMIFSRDGSPVALLFAGSDTGGRRRKGVTFANPIKTVLNALDLQIHGSV